ncbi:hypothetical protein D3C86_1499300 [compost metagenome]
MVVYELARMLKLIVAGLPETNPPLIKVLRWLSMTFLAEIRCTFPKASTTIIESFAAVSRVLLVVVRILKSPFTSKVAVGVVVPIPIWEKPRIGSRIIRLSTSDFINFRFGGKSKLRNKSIKSQNENINSFKVSF